VVDVAKILAELKAEKSALEEAIEHLSRQVPLEKPPGSGGSPPPNTNLPPGSGGAAYVTSNGATRTRRETPREPI